MMVYKKTMREFLEHNYDDMFKLCHYKTNLYGEELLELVHDFIIYLDKIKFLERFDDSKSNLVTYFCLWLSGHLKKFTKLEYKADHCEFNEYMVDDNYSTYDLFDYNKMSEEQGFIVKSLIESYSVTEISDAIGTTKTSMYKKLNKLSKNKEIRRVLK